jgi:hypothetical protein
MTGEMKSGAVEAEGREGLADSQIIELSFRLPYYRKRQVTVTDESTKGEYRWLIPRAKKQLS